MASAFLPLPGDVNRLILKKLPPPDVVSVAKSNKNGLFTTRPIIKSYCKDPITIRELNNYINSTINYDGDPNIEGKDLIFSILDGYGRYAGKNRFPDTSRDIDPIISFIQIYQLVEDGKFILQRETYALKSGIISQAEDLGYEDLEQIIPVIAFISEEEYIYAGDISKVVELPHNILLDIDTMISIFAARHICEQEELVKHTTELFKDFFSHNKDAEDEHPLHNFTLPGAIRRNTYNSPEDIVYADTREYGRLKYELCNLKEIRDKLSKVFSECDLQFCRYQVYS